MRKALLAKVLLFMRALKKHKTAKVGIIKDRYIVLIKRPKSLKL